MILTEKEKKEILSKAAEIYAFDLNMASEIPGHDGGRNLVYKIGSEAVLRISTLSDRKYEDYEAELEYVHYLAEGGASVSDSILSKNGKNTEIINDTVVSLFEVAKGDQIADHGYQYLEGVSIEEYFFNTGKVLGKIHALSKKYRPETKRFDFFDKYNVPYLEMLIPDDFICLQAITGRQIKNAIFDILNQLRDLNIDSENYGMVHFDFSDGNYNIDYTTGAINVFDFDNCRTCWYLFDIANLWSHGLGWVAWNPDSNARHAYMDNYMKKVLEGYRTECKVEYDELKHLELMVNTVLVENIIDDFEVLQANNQALVFDVEQNYKVKCLVEKASWFGFYSEFYNSEAPFEVGE